MTNKKLELPREVWRRRLERLTKKYPLVLHTDAGRAFLMVRRMKAEKRWEFP
jgi:hypothetical protein